MKYAVSNYRPQGRTVLAANKKNCGIRVEQNSKPLMENNKIKVMCAAKRQLCESGIKKTFDLKMCLPRAAGYIVYREEPRTQR